MCLSPQKARCHTRHRQIVPPEAVRAQLQRILESSEFRSSRRCQDFLTFIVGQTLAGQPLKERTVGAGVFGREASYDTNEDGDRPHQGG